jgi:hypothetical protein
MEVTEFKEKYEEGKAGFYHVFLSISSSNFGPEECFS